MREHFGVLAFFFFARLQIFFVKLLTPVIVNRLIRRIEVHKSEKIDGRKQARLDVYLTTVGLIDVPAKMN